MKSEVVSSGSADTRFLAFLDVLGFSDFVANTDHASVVAAYEQLVAVAYAEAGWSIKQVKGEDGRMVIIPDLDRPRVHLMIVSDSIVVFTASKTSVEFVNVLGFCRAALAAGFAIGLPLRGAVGIGSLARISHPQARFPGLAAESVIGAGLVSAYQLESQQEWSGAIVADDAVDDFQRQYEFHSKRGVPDLADTDYLVQAGVLTRYAAPMKRGKARESWVLNWPMVDQRPSRESIEAAFGMYGKAVGEAGGKIANTLEFFDRCRE